MRTDISEILAKLHKQTSVSVVGPMLPALVEALEAFPDASTASEALKRALLHWYHGRQENSKRGALLKIEANTEQILERLAELDELMRHW